MRLMFNSIYTLAREVTAALTRACECCAEFAPVATARQFRFVVDVVHFHNLHNSVLAHDSPEELLFVAAVELLPPMLRGHGPACRALVEGYGLMMMLSALRLNRGNERVRVAVLAVLEAFMGSMRQAYVPALNKVHLPRNTTVLMEAVTAGADAFVKFLMGTAGVDTRARDEQGRDAMTIAKTVSHTVVTEMVSRGSGRG